jgi:hypothetical protein
MTTEPKRPEDVSPWLVLAALALAVVNMVAVLGKAADARTAEPPAPPPAFVQPVQPLPTPAEPGNDLPGD